MVCCSIILPSRNGAGTLSLVLGALGCIEEPAGGAEIILVDNGSTDQTAQLMSDFAADGRAVVLHEERPGKSHALNMGIAHARGKLLVFLDDDALPSEQWLLNYVLAMENYPHAGAYAGAIFAHWLEPPPDWLAALARKGRACGCTDPGRIAGPIAPEQVKGANFAVQREVLGNLRFDTGAVNFGQGELATGGEDTLIARSLVSEGAAFRFVPEASVHHVISPDEMNLEFQLHRFARIGRGAAAIRKGGPLEATKSAGRAGVWTAQAAIKLMIGKKAEAFECLTRAAMSWGGFQFDRRRGGR